MIAHIACQRLKEHHDFEIHMRVHRNKHIKPRRQPEPLRSFLLKRDTRSAEIEKNQCQFFPDDSNYKVIAGFETDDSMAVTFPAAGRPFDVGWAGRSRRSAGGATLSGAGTSSSHGCGSIFRLKLQFCLKTFL